MKDELFDSQTIQRCHIQILLFRTINRESESKLMGLLVFLRFFFLVLSLIRMSSNSNFNLWNTCCARLLKLAENHAKRNCSIGNSSRAIGRQPLLNVFMLIQCVRACMFLSSTIQFVNYTQRIKPSACRIVFNHTHTCARE